MTTRRPARFVLLLSLLAAAACASPQTPQRPDNAAAAKRAAESTTIVLIHGLYMTDDCWDDWKAYFEELGYNVIVPTWPVFEGKSVAEIKAQHPDPELASVKLNDLVEHYASIVEALPEKPILIGHSMGGLITQKLMERGLGEAAVAINSAPPAGVLALSWPLIRNGWPILSPFSDVEEPLYPTYDDFKRSWTHLTPQERAREAYDKGFIPTSLRVAKDALDGDVASVDFEAERGPLLLVTGADDQTIPLNLAEANYEAYEASPSVTEFKVFEDRTHFILQQDGWQEVAGYIADWLKR